jgi:hypothetical protein
MVHRNEDEADVEEPTARVKPRFGRRGKKQKNSDEEDGMVMCVGGLRAFCYLFSSFVAVFVLLYCLHGFVGGDDDDGMGEPCAFRQ